MKIPAELKILGHLFLVMEVDREELDECVGQQNSSRNTIKIREDLPQSQKEQTLFHEIIHALNGEIGEVEVEFLSQAFYCVLKENDLLKS